MATDAHPGDGNAERLKKYWTEGEGAAKIRWGVPGDFDRCVSHIQAAVSKHGAPLPDHEIKGLCAPTCTVVPRVLIRGMRQGRRRSKWLGRRKSVVTQVASP
jgi:hypothetical protein